MAKSKTRIPARTTMYKGIQMRSRLEADFAAFLDRAGTDWKYEPICFAGPDGQWLPDFRTEVPSGLRTYFEIKPKPLPDDEIDRILGQMSVAWLTEPGAVLQLVIWPFRNPRGSESIMGFPHWDDDDDDMTWWWDLPGEDRIRPWPGMGQLEEFVRRARVAEAGPS